MQRQIWTRSFALLALALPLAAQDRRPADSPPTRKPAEGEVKPTPAPRRDERPAPPIALGAPVDENLGLFDLEGKPKTLKELRGKIVVLVFLGSNSKLSQAYFDRLNTLAKDTSDKPVVFLRVLANAEDVDVSPENAKRLRAFAEKNSLRELFVDREQKLVQRFNILVTPQAVVIDTKGTLVWSGQIDDDPRGENGERTTQFLKRAVNALLNNQTPGKPPSVQAGDPLVRLPAPPPPKPVEPPPVRRAGG